MAKTRSDIQGALAALVIDPLPESARNSLLLDPTFCARLGIVPKFWLPLGRDKVADAHSLHSALRMAIAGEKSTLLILRDGGDVRVKLERHRSGTATLVLKKERFSFSDADLLTSDRRKRMAAVRRVLSAKPLLAEEEETWKASAEERPFTDREYVDLMTALSSTPEGVRNELQKHQNLDVDNLIPNEPRYYERLVAPLGNATSLDAFIRDELTSTRSKLLERHPTHALRRIAFTALWQPLIPFDLLASATVSDVAQLLKAGDPFSLLFGFELCRNCLSADADFVGLGRAFLEKLLLDGNTSISRCNIFSALALISTTKLRKAARASNAPLFWVRLAALTHAGVLTDALSGMSDSESFLGWATQNFYPTYAWHGVIDRRDAPRWKPDWISPDHLYAELVGRAQGALQVIPEESRPAVWVSAIDAALGRLQDSRNLVAAYFPGPFDDFCDPMTESSTPDIYNEIQASLDTAVTLSDIPGLFALAYATQPSARVVANVLRILSLPADQPIANNEQELSMFQLCAHIAATARSEPLADAVIARCLFEVRRPGSKMALTDLFPIMAEACAAHSDSQQHRELLGRTAAKLCFSVEKRVDLSNLEAIFNVLATRDEKLIPALARARAISCTKKGRSCS